MTLPGITVSEVDGAIGSLPAGVKALAIIGTTSTGTANVPAAYARLASFVATFGAGPGVDAVAYAIRNYERPTIFVRTPQTVAGSYPGTTTVTTVGTGTSVVTVDTSTHPDNTYEIVVKVVTGCTIGVAGGVLQCSVDGGRTWGAAVALGTANSYVIPGTGGVAIEFAAGSLVAGDTHSFETRAPCWDSTSLGTALTALKNSTLEWDICYIVGDIDATAHDAIVSAFAGMPEKCWIGNTRIPTPAEADATYQASLVSGLGSKANTYGGIAAGSARITDGNTFKAMLRPIAMAVAPRIAFLQAHLDAAEIDHGPLPGVAIRDVNGNEICHDENINPGLDDARFISLRTWDGEQGVYITNPRLFSSSGSDFKYIQHRRVMNLAKQAAKRYLQRRLSKGILVDRSTGYILESEALEIEAGAHAAVAAVLLDAPKCSGGAFKNGQFVKLSRTDNLLSTEQLTCELGIIPLAYPKYGILTASFVNPANLVTPA